ncbi:sensor histidine kinase regulating citrate/malate metabolism [Tamaricihabitans halophyticus]|uniref:histidine kinase n=1 Tax=Tamaricihabitans halophyticus TaxID=1262583 RepID=A0A4R2Q7D0_9PSEU|nr:sensor histidine kinase [Tamaricihabitans halophyticus]TCP44752.1 sensor histidine kinase regulating citrate/malate metabolism [Tamaricihabitans halophyticus]
MARIARQFRKPWSLARQLLLLQVVLVGVLVSTGTVLAYLDATTATEDAAREEVTSVAETIADTPQVREALAGSGLIPLQPYAERVRADTGVDFITIMAPDGTRRTHPNPEQIGRQFLGNTAPALRGRSFTETYAGTLGPSMRAVVPVFDDQERIVGLVSVGITVRAISVELRERLLPLLATAGAVLIAGVLGTYLVSRRVSRHTEGRSPAELARMFSYYEAILHAVREGLVLVGKDGRVVLCNAAARELLAIQQEPDGTPVAELGLPAQLTASMLDPLPRHDEIHVTDTSVVVVNTAPVRATGDPMGNVVTLRNHTELQELTGELHSVKAVVESLRSQAHESANRLHTVVSLVELGRTDEAIEFATEELHLAQRLTDQVVEAVSEPVLAALLLGKVAQANERGVELRIAPESSVAEPVAGITARDLVTVLGNLLDNAIDAAAESTGRARVEVAVRIVSEELLVRVLDSGQGMSDEAMATAFERGWSTKQVSTDARGGGRGLGLALVGQVVRKHGGIVRAARVEQGTGTEFSVRLPLDREDPA